MNRDELFKAEKISDHVYWVGAIDWSTRNFHGYKTGRGTTYNAYLVVDETITLIDSVKTPFVGEMLARIRSVIGDVKKIDYIVSNHAEPDHSSGLPETIAATEPEKVFASPMGEKALTAYYGDLKLTVVKTGDSIPLGKGNIAFVETKMLHWPDSMVTYFDSDGVLFSQDAFGMHLAGSKRWADEYPAHIIEHEARKYFANILNHLSGKVLEVLEALPKLNLDIRMILPDHGPCWRRPEDLKWIFELYRECATQKPKAKAVVVYSTMWHSTEHLANALCEGLRSTGVVVNVMDLTVNDRSAIMTELAEAGIAAFGAPTMNNQVFPDMADILCYVKGLKPLNKIGFAFGSYGWSGEGAKFIAAELEAMKMEQPAGMFQVKYMPAADDLKKMFEIGETLGRTLLARVNQQ